MAITNERCEAELTQVNDGEMNRGLMTKGLCDHLSRASECY